MTPEPPCDAPIKTADGTVVATCNLRRGHISKCRWVDWEWVKLPMPTTTPASDEAA